MTNRSEGNLTEIVEQVSSRAFDRMRRDDAPTWEQLDRYTQQQVKQDLLPIIMDVLDIVDNEPKPDDPVRLDGALSESHFATYALLHGDDFWQHYRFVEGHGGSYENDHPKQHDIQTATAWCLHLEVQEPRRVRPILEALANVPVRATSGRLTGEFIEEGDSFAEWGEPREEGQSGRLGIYFVAASIPEAQATGNFMAGIALRAAGEFADDLAKHYAISTAGDYAEQIR